MVDDGFGVAALVLPEQPEVGEAVGLPELVAEAAADGKALFETFDGFVVALQREVDGTEVV